jgi:hypothetical protein
VTAAAFTGDRLRVAVSNSDVCARAASAIFGEQPPLERGRKRLVKL